MLKHLVPNNLKFTITIDDIRLKSNININQTSILTKKSFFFHNFGFYGSHLGVLGDIDGFVQLIPGTYKSGKLFNITGIDKVHKNYNCKIGSIVNGIRESILYSFGLSSPPGHTIFEQPRFKLFKKINKSVLSHITFYLQDDEYKLVDFNGEKTTFTCQLFNI